MSTIIHGSDRKSKEQPLFTKEDPFLAPILDRRSLNKKGSSKATFHLSLDIQGSSITYQEGDAVGIWPRQDPTLVEELLALLKAPKQTMVKDPRLNMEMSLENYLYTRANLSRVTPALLQLLASSAVSTQKKDFLQNLLRPDSKELRALYSKNHDVVTCLQDLLPHDLSIQEFINTLSPMLPRFYSIASSQQQYPHEIHLLVSTFSYEVQHETRFGLGSHFLCHSNTPFVPLYVQHNPNFRLPEDPKTPIIMIGPGTGIAPYRAFLQHRASLSTPTRNWLFFGECHQAFDFYYKDELETYVKKGILQLSTAFSRDQDHKIYVQHVMEENAKDIWHWIQEGCHIYLCGDATHMAKDVTHTLLSIIHKEGDLSEEDAKALLQSLRKEKRFQADVY